MDFKIFDCDRHVIEPMALWDEYVDSKIVGDFKVSFKTDSYEDAIERVKRLGKVSAGIELLPQFMVGDFPVFNHWNEELQLASTYRSDASAKQRESAMSPQGQIKSMDDSGIFQANIFPTFAGYVVNHSEVPAAVSLEYARAYNRWLKDYCCGYPDRLIGVALLSRHDPSNMVNQLEQIIEDGWRVVTLRPEVINGYSLGGSEYDQFWKVCEENSIAIALHGGSNLYAPTAGTDRFRSRFGLHACSHPMEMQMAFVSLLESGVFERHPRLRFSFLEAGASWVPSWLWRLDNICYAEYPELVKENIKMLPSEYFKRQCWVAIEIGEPCLKQVAEAIGHDRLLYGSDFPHPDHLHFDVKSLVSEIPEFSNEQVMDILHNNNNIFTNGDT